MQPISDLPYKKLRQLSRLLDPSPISQLSWQALIEELPDDFYSANQVQNFQLLAMRQDTTPAYELLLDMGKRGVTVDDLRRCLDSMKHEEAKALLAESTNRQRFRRQSSTDSTYSSFSGGSGGDGGDACATRQSFFHRSRSNYSQSSIDSIDTSVSANSHECRSRQLVEQNVQGNQDKDYLHYRGAEVGPTAPSADDPPPYEENCAIGLPQLIEQLTAKMTQWQKIFLSFFLGVVIVIYFLRCIGKL